MQVSDRSGAVVEQEVFSPWEPVLVDQADAVVDQGSARSTGLAIVAEVRMNLEKHRKGGNTLETA